MAQQDRHHQRTAGQPQPHRRRQPLDTERVKPQQDAEEDAGKNRGELCLLQHVDLVAQRLRRSIQGLFIPHQLQHVAELQAHVRQCCEDVVTAAHARHRDIVQMLQPQFTHAFAQHPPVGHHHTAVGHRTWLLHEILRAHAADHTPEFVQMRLRAHHHDQVAHMQPRP